MFFFKKRKLKEEIKETAALETQPQKTSASRRTDIKKILIIGSGPTIIGQACEFDYSGTQACKALKEEGYEVVVVNSNPATIMTDPEVADRTYIEPLTLTSLEAIIRNERPDALLPNLGGQSSLNLVESLSRGGVLRKYKVEVIGVKSEAIERGEDRIAFKKAMTKLGIPVLNSESCHSVKEAEKIVDKLGYPVVLRPAYALESVAGGVAYNIEELKSIVNESLPASLIQQVLVEEAVLGWEEFELEVLRDKNNHKITACFIENLDPMGVHTGDSCCVVPMLTASKDLQRRMQKFSYKIIEAIGILGSANVQFAHNPKDDRLVVIEINPRASRSSALASKATGFPIARISTKLAVGITLDEIPYWKKGFLQKYEPGGDYVVVKFSRWAFEKFPKAKNILGPQMKSVGEVMSIGKTFKEAFQKAIRSLEIKRYGLGDEELKKLPLHELREKLIEPSSERIFLIYEALRKGMSTEEIYKVTHIGRWFLNEIKELLGLEEELLQRTWSDLSEEELTKAKEWGFSDKCLAGLFGVKEKNMRRKRIGWGKVKQFDTVAVSGVEGVKYYYSTYVGEDKVAVSSNKKIMILAGGPNRIGQGIEFDYMCVQAALGLRAEGYEAIMVNCNPETVSTDYDSSSKLYFEPLTVEDVLDIYEKEKPEGIIVQFGGQTSANIAQELRENGANVLGTSPESVSLVKDREHFRETIIVLNIPQVKSGTARSASEVLEVARRIGYPLVVRSSFEGNNHGAEIVYDEVMLQRYVRKVIEVSAVKSLLMEKFLEKATELEIDALCDGEKIFIATAVEYIGLAGVHPGDSTCVIPSKTIKDEFLKTAEEYTAKIAKELNVIGLINIRYTIWDDKVYLLEVNPRASRTVPLVSRITAIPMAAIAAKLILGKKLSDFGELKKYKFPYFGVREAIFPFGMFPEIDPLLGPEMSATGEVMGIADTFGLAFYKAQEAAGLNLPTKGNVLLTVTDKEKTELLPIAKKIKELGFNIYATKGTNRFLKENGVLAKDIKKVHEGRPNISDAIKNKDIHLIINTPTGRSSKVDDSYIRIMAIRYKIPYISSMAAARAGIDGIEIIKKQKSTPKPIQDYLKERQEF